LSCEPLAPSEPSVGTLETADTPGKRDFFSRYVNEIHDAAQRVGLIHATRPAQSTAPPGALRYFALSFRKFSTLAAVTLEGDEPKRAVM